MDVYGKTDKYDKYLVFPTNTILGSADSSTTITHVSSGNVTIDQNLEDYEGPYFVFGTSDSGFTDGKKGYYYPYSREDPENYHYLFNIYASAYQKLYKITYNYTYDNISIYQYFFG